MDERCDETWHRLREWTNGQATSERLAAQILSHEKYTSIDPSHPLGGRDGGKDAICQKDGSAWLMAVYFPRGQKSFKDIQTKFLEDLKGVKANKLDAFAFVSNQELTLAERKILRELAHCQIEIFHLERITGILDKPEMHSVRKQFLRIDFESNSKQQVIYQTNVYNQNASTIREEVRHGVKHFYKIDPITETYIPLGRSL